MAHTFSLENTFGAGQRLKSDLAGAAQNREFNSLRISGERQQQDIQQREFDADQQQANAEKLLAGFQIMKQNPGSTPDVLEELSNAGIINRDRIPQMLAEAQNSPQTFQQKMADAESKIRLKLGQAAPGREDRTILAGADKINRFVDTGEQVFEDVEAPTGISAAGAAERFFGSLTADLSAEQQADARLIQLGLEARAGTTSATERIAGNPDLTEQVAESGATIAQRSAGARAEESRLQGIISEGQVVADGLPVLRRSLELLDVVATGGVIREAQLSFAKSLGVETANQGEISANLGKAVLSQLRATFGAQFTEAEGQRLIAIEAGFGKNNKTNRRLLNQTIKIVEAKARRAIKLARSRDDEATAQIIEESMRLSLTPGDSSQTTQVGRFTVEPVP